MCPICCGAFKAPARVQLKEDFVSHITLEHRVPRENDEPQAPIRGRRGPHLTSRSSNAARTSRRNQMQLNAGGNSSAASLANTLNSANAGGVSNANANSTSSASQGFPYFLNQNGSLIQAFHPREMLAQMGIERRQANQEFNSNNASAALSNNMNSAVALANAAAGQMQQAQQMHLDPLEDRRVVGPSDGSRDRMLTRRTGSIRGTNPSSNGLSVANVIGSNGLPYLLLMDSVPQINVPAGSSIPHVNNSHFAPGPSASNTLVDYLQPTINHVSIPISGASTLPTATQSTPNNLLLLSK